VRQELLDKLLGWAIVVVALITAAALHFMRALP